MFLKVSCHTVCQSTESFLSLLSITVTVFMTMICMFCRVQVTAGSGANIIVIDPSMSTRPNPTPPRVTLKSAAESIKNLFTNSLQSLSAGGQSSGQSTESQAVSPTRIPSSPGVIVIEGNSGRKRAGNMIIVMSQPPSGQSSAATTAAPETSLQSPGDLEVKGSSLAESERKTIDEEISESEQIGSFQSAFGTSTAYQSFQPNGQYAPPIPMSPSVQYGQSYQSYQSPPLGGSYYQPPIQVPPPGYPRVIVETDVKEEREESYVEGESKESEQMEEPEAGGGAYPPKGGNGAKMMMKMNKSGGGYQKEMMKMMKGMMKGMKSDMKKMKKGMKYSEGEEEEEDSKYQKPPTSGGKSGESESDDSYEEEEEENGGSKESGGNSYGGSKDGASMYGDAMEKMMKSMAEASSDKGCTEDDMKLMKEMMMMQMMMIKNMAGNLGMKPMMMPPMKYPKSPCAKMMDTNEYPMEYNPELYHHEISYEPEQEPEPYVPPYPTTVQEYHHHHVPSPSLYQTPIESQKLSLYPIPSQGSNNHRTVVDKSPGSDNQGIRNGGQGTNREKQVSKGQSVAQSIGETVVAPGAPCPTKQHNHQETHQGDQGQNQNRHSTDQTFVKVLIQPQTQETISSLTGQQVSGQSQEQKYRNPNDSNRVQIPVFTAKSASNGRQQVPSHVIDGIILEEDTSSNGQSNHGQWFISTNGGQGFNGQNNGQKLAQDGERGKVAPQTRPQQTNQVQSSASSSFDTSSFFQPSLLGSGSSTSSSVSTSAPSPQKKKYYRPPGHDRMIIDKLTRESLQNGKQKGRERGSEEVIREVYSDSHRIEVIKRLGSGGQIGESNGNPVRQRALRG